MNLFKLFETLLERHPGAGYFGAVPPLGGAAFNWFSRADAVLTTVGLFVALCVGILTALVQFEAWRKKRRERLKPRSAPPLSEDLP
jgi:hypothetical protein